jgi:predicted  nucleic acid-binding Zn-ribbon protein
MRFAFGEDEVKRIAKAVKAFEQGQGSSDLKASGPRHVASHLSLVKVTTPATPYSTGKCVDFIASDGTYIEKETVKIKDVGGKTLSANSYHVGYFAGYKQGEPVFFVTLGGSSGDAFLEVVTDVQCTPTGLQLTTVSLSGADYDNAVIRQFLGLSDVTPKSFLGNQNRAVIVNDKATALEFGPILGSEFGTFLGLTDTPNSYTGTAYKSVGVNSSATALTFYSNQVTTGFSIQGGGNPNAPSWAILSLKGDQETPGNLKQYSTDKNGNRGWFDIAGNQKTTFSITGDGSELTPLKLVNDQETPGTGKYYGTNEAGNRGWFELPAVDLENRVTALEEDVATLEITTASHATTLAAIQINLTTIESSLTSMASTVSGHTADISALQSTVTANSSSITSLNNRVTSIENAPYASQSFVTYAIATETADRQQGDSALDARITSLENADLDTRVTTLENTTTNLSTNLTSLQTTVTGVETSLSSLQTTVSSHTSSISSLQTTVSGHTTDLSNLQTSINTETTNRTNADNALDGRISTLEGQNLNSRLTTAEGSITTLQGEMTTAQADINGLDGRLDVLESQTLDTRLTAAESAITTLQGDVTGIDGRLTTLEGQTLDTRLTTLEGQTLDTRLTTIEGQTLDTRVTTLEGQTLDTRLTTLEGQTLDTRLTTLEGQTLDTRLTTLEGQTLDTRLTALETYDLDTRVTTLEGYVTSSALTLGGVQVVGTQQAAVADAVGGTIDDTDVASCASSTQSAIDDLTTQLNAALAALRAHGLIAT